MTQFSRRIAPHVDAEIAAARHLDAEGAAAASFARLERAHVLGQASTFHHVRVHRLMLTWALRHRAWKEVRGQALRIVGAATKTALGWVPAGNTGGSNVSPFKPLPILSELQRTIDAARRTAHGASGGGRSPG